MINSLVSLVHEYNDVDAFDEEDYWNFQTFMKKMKDKLRKHKNVTKDKNYKGIDMKSFQEHLAGKKDADMEAMKPQEIKDIEVKIAEAKESKNVDALETLLSEKVVLEAKYDQKDQKMGNVEKSQAMVYDALMKLPQNERYAYMKKMGEEYSDKMMKKMPMKERKLYGNYMKENAEEISEAKPGDRGDQEKKMMGGYGMKYKHGSSKKMGMGDKTGSTKNQEKKDAGGYDKKYDHSTSKKGQGMGPGGRANQEGKMAGGYKKDYRKSKMAMESFEEFSEIVKEGITDGSWNQENIEILESVLLSENQQMGYAIDDMMNYMMSMKKMMMPHSNFYRGMAMMGGDHMMEMMDKMYMMIKEMMMMGDDMAMMYGEEYMDEME